MLERLAVALAAVRVAAGEQRKGRPEVAEIRARAAVNEPQAAVSEMGLPPEQDPFAELGIDPDDYSDSE